MQDMETFETFIESPALEAYVGTNAATYRKKWRKMFAKSRSIDRTAIAPSWNWAGFFLCIPWLFYRKLYIYAAIFSGILVGEVALEVVLELDQIRVHYAIFVMTGLFGDTWYFKRTYNAVRQAECQAGSAEEAARSLAGKGVSRIAAILGTSACVTAIVAATLGASIIQETKSPKLEEVSGVWRSQAGEVIVVNLTDNQEHLVVNDQVMAVRVRNVDEVNHIVELSLPLQDGSETTWSLRQKWDAGMEEFYLTLVLHDGSEHDLAFVRAILPADVPADRPIEPQAPQSPSSTTGSPA